MLSRIFNLKCYVYPWIERFSARALKVLFRAEDDFVNPRLERQFLTAAASTRQEVCASPVRVGTSV